MILLFSIILTIIAIMTMYLIFNKMLKKSTGNEGAFISSMATITFGTLPAAFFIKLSTPLTNDTSIDSFIYAAVLAVHISVLIVTATLTLKIRNTKYGELKEMQLLFVFVTMVIYIVKLFI